ncbi:Uncharacterised protein [Streptococcus pneumoniae]|nr:Uncharacterised protein [Streptococcus pneumoniae]
MIHKDDGRKCHVPKLIDKCCYSQVNEALAVCIYRKLNNLTCEISDQLNQIRKLNLKDRLQNRRRHL